MKLFGQIALQRIQPRQFTELEDAVKMEGRADFLGEIEFIAADDE